MYFLKTNQQDIYRTKVTTDCTSAEAFANTMARGKLEPAHHLSIKQTLRMHPPIQFPDIL